MSEATPIWVRQRDGRVVPFDSDQIAQDLFAAAETLGQANAFLARELTDGVLHFLAADAPEGIPTTEWIAEQVVKVVRELRQPRLAQAFAERPHRAAAAAPVQPADVVRRSLHDFSLEHVFARNLAAAHHEGLLSLAGLDAPTKVAALLVSPTEPLDLLEAFAEARQAVAGWLVLDGPEHFAGKADFALLLRLLRTAGVPLRVQLNSAEPPPWAANQGQSPLFAEQGAVADPAVLVQALLANEAAAIDWHLGERDFSQRSSVLYQLTRTAAAGGAAAFVFDRPRRPVALGPGLDLRHPALLMTVGAHLPALLQHGGAGGDLEQFLLKLASLARLAVSAGVQKRQFLREHGAPVLQRGFLLERARLLVYPAGLAEVVQHFTEATLADDSRALDVGRRILQQLHEVLSVEGPRRLVDCVLGAPPEGPWEPLARTRPQLRALGRLHAISGTGAAAMHVTDEHRLAPEELVDVLEFAWRQTDVARLHFQPQPQTTTPALL